MNTDKRGSLLRCLLTWLAATAAATAVVAWAAADLTDAWPALTGRGAGVSFDSWLVWLCAGAIASCAGWGWLVTTVVVVEAMTRCRVTPGRGVPRWARRLVLGACGVVVLGSSAPALAAQAPPDNDGTADPTSLHGLPLPDRAEGRSVSDVVARVIADAPASEPTGSHRVRPGDSLWSIAHAALSEAGPTPTSTDVAAYWPRVYALNRDVVGPDPDLLRPGQVLRLARPIPTSGEDPR